jgi:hypothetical protein
MKFVSRASLKVSFVAALFVVCFNTQASAQQRGRTPTKRASKNQTSTSERDAASRLRHTRAINLLNETADAARDLDDFLYRARLQALAAETLWPYDAPRARILFERAWEAATLADKEQQELDQTKAVEITDAPKVTVTEARQEILSKIAAHDSSLTEKFLNELRSQDEGDEANSNQPSRATTSRELSASNLRRLALAYELLDRGANTQASQLISPLLNEGVTPTLMLFILHLREQDAAVGETLYHSLIEATQRNVQADSNSILLLSTPIVSPELLIFTDTRGGFQYRPVPRLDPKQKGTPMPISLPTRRAFYDVAASVLTRPLIAHDAGSSNETTARYFAIERLMPFYEREAAQYLPQLSAARNTITNEIEASRRQQLSAQINLKTLSRENSSDPLRSDVEQLSHAQNDAERDRLSLRIVRLAANNKYWDRARRTADNISDLNVRRAALSFIAVNQIADISRAYADDKEDDDESLAKFVASADVPPFARAWGFAQTAVVAARKKDSQQRVRELLTEAEHNAARVDTATRQRVAAYAVITEAAAHLDAPRAWELLNELVKATNEVEDFTGDEPALEIEINDTEINDDDAEPFSISTAAFRLDKIFATMATLDFERAISTARTLDGKTPQAFVNIAIARATLEREGVGGRVLGVVKGKTKR